ncbi:MAG TPA: SDR family oxidoreductase [Caulobacteraceae bacterium]|nr:SDR family oxidoreductase [Caulobacteraceae bacterium]
MQLLIFGYGFTGRTLARRLLPKGWTVCAAVRRPEVRAAAEADGVKAVDAADMGALGDAAAGADAVLITAPPSSVGCPGIATLSPALTSAIRKPSWVGYLSTTGVYGDREGRWVFETSATNAHSVEGARRVAAEQDWRNLGEETGVPVAIFRLPGIYGPGRSPLDRVRDGTAHRLVKPGQVFSRIHVEDLAAGLEASMARPRPGAIYHLCDDEPAPSDVVTAFAAELIGKAPPPEQPYDDQAASPALRRFYGENKRVSNALAKSELGWRPAFPSYREGLRAVLEAETSRL